MPVHEGVDGELDCIDTAGGEGEEAPIAILNPDLDPDARELTTLAADFGIFFLELVMQEVNA